MQRDVVLANVSSTCCDVQSASGLSFIDSHAFLLGMERRVADCSRRIPLAQALRVASLRSSGRTFANFAAALAGRYAAIEQVRPVQGHHLLHLIALPETPLHANAIALAYDLHHAIRFIGQTPGVDVNTRTSEVMRDARSTITMPSFWKLVAIAKLSP